MRRPLRLVGIAGLFLLAFLVFSLLRSFLHMDEAPLKEAQVSKSSRALTIQNASAERWTNCTAAVEADRPYTSQVFDLPPGKELEIPLRNFIARDGIRFNPWVYGARRVVLECGSTDYRRMAVFEFRLLKS